MRASVLIPTRDRADYLAVALRSIAPQAAEAGAEVVVVQDAAEDPAVVGLCGAFSARYVAHGAPRGPNAARNTALSLARGELLVFVDDDVEVWPGWLDALLAAADALPAYEAFGGPIRPRIEGLRLRACGREDLAVPTALDLGSADRDAALVWSANMAVRRPALERLGGFDVDLERREAPRPGAATTYGDEEEWLRRLAAAGGRVRYVAAAGVDHRRAGADATWRALGRAAWFRGRIARRYDERKGVAPSVPAEARVVAGSVWHLVRRRCGNGVLLAAVGAGRLREALASPPPPPPGGPDFLSGASGTLSRRGLLAAFLRDGVANAATLPEGLSLHRRSRSVAKQRVLAVCVARPGGQAEAARRELLRSRHAVEVRLIEAAPGRGRWANINAALADGGGADGYDWLLVFDDDVVLPRGFLDVFVLCCVRLGFRMAQPAHAFRSHAAWPVTRRRPRAVARRTRFVEQGPVLALHAEAVRALSPFPALQMGWGVDNHWSAVAAERGWPIGIVDATPVRHLNPVAGSYAATDAIAEAQDFLAGRPYVRRNEAVTVRAFGLHDVQ